MFGTLGTILLIVSLVFGGGGVTVAAAQGSMPDQALYPVKTWSENVRTRLTTGDVNQLRLALELAERRAEEMQMTYRDGQTPAQALQNRWEGELDEALKLAAGLTHDPQFQAHLEKIQNMAQTQKRAFEQIGPQKDPAGEALLTRTRVKLGEVLMLCQQGQQDPNTFQKNVQELGQKQFRDGEQAGDQNQKQNGEQAGDQNQDQNGEQAGDQNQEQNGVQAGDQNQEQNQEQNGQQAGDQNQEQNQEQNGEQAGDQDQEQNRDQNCGSDNGCDSHGPSGSGEGYGPGPGDGDGSGDGSGGSDSGNTGGGSGSTDPGSDNTGGSNSGSGSTGSDTTGGDASGSEGNGNGSEGGSSGGDTGGGGDSGGGGSSGGK